MIRFTCPACKSILQSPGPTAADKVACPNCGQRLLVPNPVKPAASKEKLLVPLMSESDRGHSIPSSDNLNDVHAEVPRRSPQRKLILLAIITVIVFGAGLFGFGIYFYLDTQMNSRKNSTDDSHIQVPGRNVDYRDMKSGILALRTAEFQFPKAGEANEIKWESIVKPQLGKRVVLGTKEPISYTHTILVGSISKQGNHYILRRSEYEEMFEHLIFYFNSSEAEQLIKLRPGVDRVGIEGTFQSADFKSKTYKFSDCVIGSYGKDPYSMMKVSGRVLFQGKPFPGGRVTFFHVNGEFASLCQIDENGNYQLEAPVGDVQISVMIGMLQSNSESKRPHAPKKAGAESSQSLKGRWMEWHGL